LREVLAQIAALAEKGETTEAYAARRALVRTYPDLKENAALARAAASIAEAEAENVQVIDEPRAALADEHPSPLTASLAVAHRRGGAVEGVAGHPVFARAQGAVYALDLASGHLLWRRWAGFEPSAPPVALGAGADADVLIVDAARDELARLEGKSGRLMWRLPLGERFGAPVVTRFGAFVAARSGKIFAVDAESGASPRPAVIQQELDTPPAVHPRADCLYQIGRHSNLYVLSATDLSCLEVFYLGHEPGAVAAPPVVAGRNVLVAENWGDDDATLHVLAADEQGRSLERVQEIRLKGRVLAPPLVEGRQVVVCTSRGEISVFEISPADGGEPLTRVAHRDPEAEAPRARYLALRDGRLWLAGRQLTRFAIHAAGGRLVAEGIQSQEIGDTFVRPLRVVGDLLIHVRRRQNAAGWAVAAARLEDGRRVWETDLAAPPAGAPVVNFARREIALATADGAVFRFDPAAIKARVQDAPLPVAAPDASTESSAMLGGLTPPARLAAPLTTSVAASATAWAFAPDAGGAAWLAYDAERDASAARWFALPSPLACPPAALGGNLLAPTRGGRVLLLDPSTGEPRAAPFQPRIEPGATLPWRTPGATEAGDRAVVSDGRYKLYLLGVEQQPKPHLSALAETDNLLHPITSPVAVLGKLAMALDDAGRLQKFSLPELKSAGDVELGGQAVWGPRRVGGHVLLVNESEELLALDAQGEIAWRRPLEHGLLAGAPLAVEGGYLCAARDGALFRIDAATGETVAEVHLGQPLASGPAAFGPRVVVAGHDGTLLVVAPPEKE
jgi:outer membrane protein assembly factor BamB